MGTLNEKLDYLKETKSQIKEAIISKGQSVSSSDTFRSYASKISAINTVNNEDLTVNPMTSVQTFTPTQGHTGFGEVNVNAVTSAIDSNIQAGNIKQGVEILGVTGEYEGAQINNQDKTVTTNGTYTADSGYTGLGEVTVAVNATGATEVAINRTGAAINAGDKVWVNQQGIENKLITFDNEVYNIASSDMYNIASLGRYFTPATNNSKYLSISDTSISNFTSSLFTSSSNDFELVVKFFVNSASEHSRIFSLQSNSNPGTSFFTWCSLSEDSDSLRKISLGFSYAQNAWDSINLNTEIEDNTWYCLMYSRSSGKLSLSLAKNSVDNVVETVTNPRDNVVFYCSTSYTYLSLAQTNFDYIPLTYDLSEVSFTSSYQNINWKALDLGNITEKTITGTAAESILAGATGNVYLGDKGALQSKVATSNGTVTPSEGYHGLSKVTVNVVGTGAEVEGKNYTGAVINEGDKVWINPYYYEAGSYSTDFAQYCYIDFLLSDGHHYFNTQNGDYYQVGDNVKLGTLDYYRVNDSNYGICQQPDGIAYTRGGFGMQRVDSAVGWSNSNWQPVNGRSDIVLDSSSNSIHRINIEDGSIIATMHNNNATLITSSMSSSYWINGKIYAALNVNGNSTYSITLDEDNNTFSYEQLNSSFWFEKLCNQYAPSLGVTSDGEFIINRTSTTVEIISTSENKVVPLSDIGLPSDSRVFDINGRLSFDMQTNVLCTTGFANKSISEASSGLSGAYQYNPNTKMFEKISLDFSNFRFFIRILGTKDNVLGIYGSKSGSYYGVINYPEKITGNNLVSFGPQITSNTQTGTAAENITVGSTGTVKVGAKITPTGSITLTNNGTYNVMDYATAVVDNPNVLKHWYNWKTDTVIGTNTIGNFGESVAYGNDTFVGVTTGNNYVKYKVGSQSIAQSTLPITAQGTNWGPKIAYGNERFIIILGTNSSDYLYSDDGINWSQGVFSDSYLCQNIVYGNRKFIITIGGSSTYLYSSDGLSWTTGTLPKAVSNTSYFNNLSFANNKFIIVADSTCMYSDDGINWSTSTVDTDTGIYCDGSIYVNGVYVVIRNYGITGYSFKYYYSSDLSNWSSGTLPSDWKYWDARIASNGRECLMTSYNNQKVLYSTDGINWRQYDIFAAQSNSALFVADNSFYAVRASNTIKVIPFYSTAYTLDEVPTTSSVVYSAPNTQSSLTVTTGGSAQITLSDENVYYRNTIDDIQEHLPTGSITITENGTHDVTDYAEAIVNVTDVPAVVESLSITPSTSQQTFTPGTGVDGYAPVNVSAVDSTIDENIVAGNIKKDVTILGVTGTLEEGPQINNQNISVTTDGTYTADSGYTGLGTVTVTAGAVASAATQNEIAEELMLINDGATTFTLTVSPTDATPVITSTTNSVNITPTSSSDGTYVYDISMDSSKSYSYSVSKEGYVTSTGTINGGTASLTITLVAES